MKSGQSWTQEEKSTYQAYKAGLMEKWRPIIFERDGHKCIVCESFDDLQLAHVTPAIKASFRAVQLGIDYLVGLESSFRTDNLVTLCRRCHAHVPGEMHENIGRYDYDPELSSRVDSILELIIRDRGWKNFDRQRMLER